MGQGRRRRTPRWRKATALLPLVLLSGAWSANAASDRTPETEQDSGVPGVPTVPAEIFDEPASVALPEGTGKPGSATSLAYTPFDGSRGSAAGPAVADNGIPTSALLAYKRAADILNQADPACHLDWSLVAAIGKVESDHGRYAGNALNDDGRAVPGIYGVPLTGAGNIARITDSDGGALDRDVSYDRAVGPMQFIPGTWRLVGVDSDFDGKKDPQDIDDAATATAVYLCAGAGDLSTDAGQRAAVLRYNHSQSYVDLVLSIAQAYASGNYAPVPNGTPTTTTLTLAKPAPKAKPAKAKASKSGKQSSAAPATTKSDNRSSEPSTSGGSSEPSTGGGGSSGGSNDGGDSTTTPAPQAPEPVTKVVEKLETLSEATAFCAKGLQDKTGVTQKMIDACGAELVGKTVAEATSLLSGPLKDVLGRLGLSDLLCLGILC
ncbi:MAG: lytic transglycosylase domain-containing protein [Nocardioidaceae bacterium]